MAMESLQKRWNEWLGAFKKKDAGGDKEAKIKATNVVYVFGPMGTGKSFTGDYMDVVHGYHHVDGDTPLKHMTLVPEYKEMVEKMVIDGDWAPFFSEIARLTVEAAKDHEKVVVSHAAYKNEERDHVVKKLVEGGVSEDHITLIQLTIDPRVKARGLYYRTKRQAEQSGMTLTELVKSGGAEFEGEMTEEKFIEIALAEEAKSPDEFQNHPDAIMVDISGRDVSHFDNVDKALGLTRSSDLTYEGVCAKVKPIDEARDKKVMENGFFDAMAEIGAKAAAKNGDNSLVIDEEGEEEKKVEEMKKRRSALVELERSMRGLSFRESSKKGSMRRKSLIKTGKVDEE